MRSLYSHLQPSRLLRLADDLYAKTRPDVLHPPSFTHLNQALLNGLELSDEGLGVSEIHTFLNSISDTHPCLSTVYAGHQFGIYTSRLGDGRVHILGDIKSSGHRCFELQLKGAGATPFARGNDGRMSLAEAIREYLGSEALAGLGIASSRVLMLIRTAKFNGATAILLRVAQNHLRFGHFEYLHNQGHFSVLRQLADLVINEDYPELMGAKQKLRYLRFLQAVTQRTARMLARWQAIGFVHGVMNTDNMSISGNAMDLGVFAFMERYDPAFCANENDDQQRYAFDQQVDVGRWNCLALAEALSELLPGKRIPASLLRLYGQSYRREYQKLMRVKLGLLTAQPEDDALIRSLLTLLARHQVPYNDFFHQFQHFESRGPAVLDVLSLDQVKQFLPWFERFGKRLCMERSNAIDRQRMMQAVNPRYLLKQADMDHVIARAESADDFAPLDSLLQVLRAPYAEPGRRADDE